MIQFVFLERVTISGLRVRSCITKMRVGGWGLSLLLLKINADAYARRIPISSRIDLWVAILKTEHNRMKTIIRERLDVGV